jgi:hypothetical protein
MYAMIRRYRMGTGSIDELMHKVDTQFADQLSEASRRAGAPVQVPPGIASYQAINTGHGTLMTITVFETEQQGQQAQRASENIRKSLSEFQVEEIETFMGEVMVSRATETVLDPVHH